ncbi:MAG TPA: glycosyltransferase [Anaerolineae bacterium]|nr:glycosyltransferase [Anaerolineae bacterium]
MSQPALRVLFISGQDGGTRRYRCDHPQAQLEPHGIATGFREASDLRLLADALDYDVFILHRVPYSDLIGRVLEWAQQLGKPALFETDDLIFEPDLVEYDGHYRSLPPDEARAYERKVQLHLKTLAQCDYALTTTEYLAEALRRRGQPTFVHRNALGTEFVRLAQELQRPHVEHVDKRVVIGYVSGSVSHDQDFATITDALLHVLNRRPNVELLVIGPLNLSERFTSVAQQVRMRPLLPWKDIPRESQTIDINLAPLELDNPFCQSKSEVKYFEAGILGIPTVASPTDAFKFAIRHGETGFLAGNTHEWIESLERLIDNPNLRRSIGAAARRDALKNYVPQVRGRQLAPLLQTLADEHRREPDNPAIQETVERQVIAYLTSVLEEVLSPSYPAALPRPYDDTLWRRRYLFEGRAELRDLQRERGGRWLAGLMQRVIRSPHAK